MKDAPEDFIDPPPDDPDRMTYEDFLSLLSSFANIGWTIVRGAIRSERSHKSPFSIICEEMMQLDIAGEDYIGAEAHNLSKKDARRIIRALNGNEDCDVEVRKDLLRALGLLGERTKKSGA